MRLWSFLLERGAELKVEDDGCASRMLLEASRTGRLNWIRLLLAGGLDIDAKDAQGRTALYEAAWGGAVDAIKLLLDKGANIHAKDARGRNALQIDIWKRRKETVELLVSRGCLY